MTDSPALTAAYDAVSQLAANQRRRRALAGRRFLMHDAVWLQLAALGWSRARAIIRAAPKSKGVEAFVAARLRRRMH